jgi:hypothetical protein
MSIPRVIFGQKGTKYGLYVSKPGIDVNAADLVQLAFSTDHTPPRLVASGAISIGSTASGLQQSAATVLFGQTFASVPFAAAVVSAPDWTLALSGANNGGAQLQYLNGQWNTFIMERPLFSQAGFPNGQTNLYGPTIQRTSSGFTTFASARFTMQVWKDRVLFIVNNRNTVTVKYVILEP